MKNSWPTFTSVLAVVVEAIVWLARFPEYLVEYTGKALYIELQSLHTSHGTSI